MKIVRNTGTERVIDLVRPWLVQGNQLDIVTSSLSLFAYSEILGEVAKLAKTRLLLPPEEADLALFGTDADRGARNRFRRVGSPDDAPLGFKRKSSCVVRQDRCRRAPSSCVTGKVGHNKLCWARLRLARTG